MRRSYGKEASVWRIGVDIWGTYGCRGNEDEGEGEDVREGWHYWRVPMWRGWEDVLYGGWRMVALAWRTCSRLRFA